MPAEPVEFSRPLPLGRVGPEGRTETLVATATECAALARRYGIPGVEALQASLRLVPETDGAVRVEGRLEAAVTQECVVTLDPVPQRVADEFVLRLLPPGQAPADGPDDLDEIATEHGIADLGEVVAEQLALALNPYPRAPDAALPPEAQEAEAGAFAALAGLRRGGPGGT